MNKRPRNRLEMVLGRDKAKREIRDFKNEELPDDIKQLCVVSLAKFNPPSLVAKQIFEHFGVNVDSQRIAYYDPTRDESSSLGEKWRELFKVARREYLGDLSRIRLSNKVERLKELTRLFARVKKEVVKAGYEPEDHVRYVKEARAILEQIGEESHSAIPVSLDDSGNARSGHNLPDFIMRALGVTAAVAERALEGHHETKRLAAGDAPEPQEAEIADATVEEVLDGQGDTPVAVVCGGPRSIRIRTAKDQKPRAVPQKNARGDRKRTKGKSSS